MPRWLLFDYVDPELGLSREQRRAVRGRAYLHVTNPAVASRVRDRKAVFSQILIAMVPSVLMFGVLFYVLKLAPARLSLIPFIVIVEFIVSWVLIAWLAQWGWKPYVLRALNELGHRVCGTCGYRLPPDQKVDLCSECGSEVTPQGSHDRSSTS